MVLFFPVFFAKAQLGEKVIVNVTYEFVHVDDLNNRDKPLKETMLLQLGQSTSKYKKTSIPRNIITKTAVTSSTQSQNTGVTMGGPLAVVFGAGFTIEELFQYPKENKIEIFVTQGMYDYKIVTGLPKISWKIMEESKVIDKYICQKAIGDYAGRTYVVWFAPDLPFQSGPWKLSGLPGLILEAKDLKNEVFFLFKNISKQQDDNIRISSLKTRLINVSEKEFARLKNAYNQNPVVAMQAQLPPGTENVQLAYRDATGIFVAGDEATALIEKNKKDAKYKKYNPLELIKK